MYDMRGAKTRSESVRVITGSAGFSGAASVLGSAAAEAARLAVECVELAGAAFPV
jgi:hypothetical protein